MDTGRVSLPPIASMLDGSNKAITRINSPAIAVAGTRQELTSRTAEGTEAGARVSWLQSGEHPYLRQQQQKIYGDNIENNAIPDLHPQITMAALPYNMDNTHEPQPNTMFQRPRSVQNQSYQPEICTGKEMPSISSPLIPQQQQQQQQRHPHQDQSATAYPLGPSGLPAFHHPLSPPPPPPSQQHQRRATMAAPSLLARRSRSVDKHYMAPRHRRTISAAAVSPGLTADPYSDLAKKTAMSTATTSAARTSPPPLPPAIVPAAPAGDTHTKHAQQQISTLPPFQHPQHQEKYKCSRCPKTFSRPSSLRVHIYSHTGEKPHVCPHPGCDRRFSVQSNMRRHLRVHYCSSFPDTSSDKDSPESKPIERRKEMPHMCYESDEEKELPSHTLSFS
ncbi:hypothetical protein BCR43DRAFT_498062 [Syncephalastrum racemosum]|uniref:C2H2-type domain-containing protein n=1 Tax=Syncephalastrum racemosum TaxID=13706 RepID=A0A1X2H3G4_SYNRA|nr:hypothetical protein BCR43DRAFT_498062 [Syncephalastrum racemosum]